MSRISFHRGFLFIAMGYIAMGFAISSSAQDLPKPKFGFVRVSEQVNNGVAVRTYEVEVANRDKFDNDLFVPSPALPACGQNANASRTWLNIYDGDGIRLQGWCAINASGELAALKFNIPSADPQPRSLFIEFIDRFNRRIRRSKTVRIKGD